MGVVLIIIGGALGAWAYAAHRRIETQRPIIFQGPLGGLILLLVTLAGFGLPIAGLVMLFS